MYLLHEALAESSNSNTFQVTGSGVVSVAAIGTWDGMVANLEFSPDGTTYTDWYSGGAAVTLSSVENLISFEVGGGLWFRLATSADSSNAGDIDVYIDGDPVTQAYPSP